VDAKAKTRELFSSAPRPEIPKGGGAIRGIGETFKANTATGTASFSVPVALSPGRNGLTPALALSYDSGAGNGPFGLGWSLSLPAIRRRTDRALPRYRDAEDSDTFVLSEAEDLVPFQSWTGAAWAEPALTDVTEGGVTYRRRRYRPRVEGAFARVERWTNPATGVVHWRTWSAQNVRRLYGLSPGARLADPDDARRVFAWHLEEERDELGNLAQYEYKAEDRAGAAASLAERLRTLPGNHCANLYLKRVLYGNVTPGTAADGFYFEVVFDYGEHPGAPTDSPLVPPSHAEDPASPWATRADPFSSFRAGFDVRGYRVCQRVLVYHRFDDPTGATEPTLVRSTEFAYAPSPVATTLTSITVRGWRQDAVSSTWATEPMPALTLGYSESVVDATLRFVDGVQDLPQGLDASRWQWIDLDGEGMAGLLSDQGGQWYYKRNNGAGELAPARVVRHRPTLAQAGDPRVRMLDLDGDGRPELVSLHPGMAGSFTRSEGDDGWQPLQPFRTLPTTPLDDPRVRMLDLDGDGLPEVVVSEDDCFTIYPSRGRDGWGKPERRGKPRDEDLGPALVFSNASESLFLADMTGDGLTDLVRVRNGHVDYWPNRGHGRFGGKVFMGKSPWMDARERFDPRRVRLADVDGSGPADLIYLGPRGVRIWQNEAGNRFSTTPVKLPQFPGLEDSAGVQVADLLGDGTACLVWSSPLLRDTWRPLRFVHLMGDGKPYLLRTIDNGLGRTTALTYAPSTQFMVEDREAGTPWATRLPFPVQVLTKVEVVDAVTAWRGATRYAYHHGYFDAPEREFRGFGKVEQWDTDTVSLDGVPTDLPPVRTVSWFHTGAWRVQGTLEARYAQEYFAGDGAAFARTACATGVLDGDPAALRARELREAARALRGRLLRQEVYAEDGSAEEALPYLVTEAAWTASRLQRADNDHHGAFVVTPRQSVTYHYERDATDPRVVQEQTLEVDDYGVVTRSATVIYPRRGTGHDADQATGVVLVTRNEVIHDDAGFDASADHWHVGVGFRSRAWHLVPSSSSFFDELVPAGAVNALLPTEAGGAAATTVVAFDDAAPSSGDYLRKLSDKLTTYDDGGAEADAGTMGARALPWQVYQLAYTATQATALDDLLDALGLGGTHAVVDQGYAELTGAAFASLTDIAGTWARSGIQARYDAHFYVPTSLTDPFGNTTSVTWHASYLFAESVTDALGNVVEATYDLVALAPSSVTDPNRNVTLARYDALGRVTAIARASDTGDGETDLDDSSQVFSYDLTTVPSVANAKVRDTHASEAGAPGWIETYAYSDGAGNVVMQKATAAPDAATPSTPRWVGSGRVVLNNKGLPVKQYEPFFADSEAFEAEEGFAGVTPVITYDPLGRPTRVDLPNGTLRKVAFSPWGSVTWDENDCADEATDADPALVARAAAHVGTPTVVKVDVQGRAYRTREFLSAVTESEYESGGSALETSLTLDVVGNPRTVTDARGNAIQEQTFDLLGRPILTSSPDGGDVTLLLDVGGQPRFAWKSGDLCEEAEFDALRRKVRTWEWATSGTPAKTLRERIVHGEALDDPGTYDPRDDDLRGRVVYVFDGAGSVETAYDWKGNATSVTRRFATDGESVPDWTAHDGGAYPFAGDDAASVDAFLASADADLESEAFAASSTFDALDRVVTATAPDSQLVANGYDAGGRLTSVAVTTRDAATSTVVSSITYNARGQRESIAYGNGATSTYTYEADTFRLSRLYTEGDPDGDSVSDAVQDLNYLYDPVGNVVSIENAAEDTLYHDNAAVDPSQEFTYDALYRLTVATGRERTDRDAPGYQDPSAGTLPCAEVKRTYTESYVYDDVGNIESMTHTAGGSTTWTRTYTYEAASNRLVSTQVVSATSGTVTEDYVHDDRGSLVYLPTLRFSSGGATPNIETSFRDQMVHALLPTSGQEAFYQYDAGGQRVRKRVVTGTTSERRYVGGWEVYREYDSGENVEEERSTLHVADGQSRVLLVETKTVTGGVAETTLDPVLRYQLGDHLGTVAIELDEDGGFISYEEYSPYGATAWWAGDSALVSQKRYKFTGMERDEETGLQCHGVRYYATWLGRWTSADPIGLGDGVNRYGYCHEGPAGGLDSSGTQEWPPEVPTGSDFVDLPNGGVRMYSDDFKGEMKPGSYRRSELVALQARDGGAVRKTSISGPLVQMAMAPLVDSWMPNSVGGNAIGLLAEEYPDEATAVAKYLDRVSRNEVVLAAEDVPLVSLGIAGVGALARRLTPTLRAAVMAGSIEYGVMTTPELGPVPELASGAPLVPAAIPAYGVAEGLLRQALRLQGLSTAPAGGFKQAWSGGGFDYEVRVHPADPKHGGTGSIYRVARRAQGVDANKQGAGWEYVDDAGVWHKESTQKPGSTKHPNKSFNPEAAKATHLKLPGGG
jgi:RHS repeat-associated protein